MRERNVILDIMKGIGIILMVAGHSGCPTILVHFLGTFHMPLFFMISGWLISGNSPHILKRIKALYYPFLFWGIIALILQYPLYEIGIYSKPYDYHDYFTHFMHIVTFAQSEPITGPLWFLKSLFFSYIFVSIIVWKIKSKKKNYIIGIFCFLMLCLGYMLYKHNGWLFYNIQRELMMPWLLWLGYYIRNRNIKLHQSPILVIFCILFLTVAGQYESLDLAGSKIGNPLILTIYSIIGFMITYNIANYLNKKSAKLTIILAYIGRNTMPILILHLISIKIIQIAMDLCNINVDLSQILMYSDPYWLLYSIAGVTIPLLLNQLYNISIQK